MSSGRDFQKRITLAKTMVSWPAVALVILYLMALLRLPPSEKRAFYECVIVGVALLGPLITWLYQRIYREIARVLDRHESGEAADEELREGFAALSRLPVTLLAAALMSWFLSAVAVLIVLRLRAPGIAAFSLVSLFMGLVSGAVVSEAFGFFLTKRTVEPERLRLAAAIGDPDERGELVVGVGVSRKLRVSVAGVTLLTVVFAVLLSLSAGSRSLEGFAARIQHRFLERLEADAGAGALAAVEAEARELGAASGLLVVDSGTGALRYGVRGGLTDSELDAILRSDADQGDATGYDSPNALAWRRLPGGEAIAVLVAPMDSVAVGAGRTRWILAVVLALSTGIAWLLGYVLSDDLGRATGWLQRRAGEVAEGDLRCDEVYDGEDELGALGRGFDRMAKSLRAMVTGVVQVASRLESASGRLTGAADSVSEATREQVRAIHSAHDAMGEINSGVRGIAETSAALTLSVDESLSTVHELGAVGGQLNETSLDLSGRVDSVSSAVEEMAASVREVARSADALTEASTETSGSMEEMASSVHEVETNASETARLSGEVVGAAEKGASHVAQTIAGMDAIRLETDTARRVIGQLGESAAEIGGIVEVITDVADETNLLALNAAIISAQAGENGRAFSVVADQIKGLADRVLASTREIAERVRAVQEETAGAVAAIERGAERVAEGVDRSAEAGESLEEINRAARESGDRTQEIVAAMRQQTKAASHVVQLMEQVQTGVERIRRASQEQDRGNELILNETVDMRNAAQRVRSTTEEQQAGTTRIRDAFDGVRAAVEQISEAVRQQSLACNQGAEMLDAMSERTDRNEESATDMGDSIRELLRDADDLRRSVERFRL